jgi:ornithine carbamoyltransferase
VVELARHATVPVINGLSDYNHPCQAMADVLTILEHFGRLDGLRVAFVGDGNNVAVSLLFACARLGMDFAIASPEGYEIPAGVREKSLTMAREGGSEARFLRDADEAVQGAHVIYTDTWTSMGQEAEKGGVPALPGECPPGGRCRPRRDRDALPSRTPRRGAYR